MDRKKIDGMLARLRILPLLGVILSLGMGVVGWYAFDRIDKARRVEVNLIQKSKDLVQVGANIDAQVLAPEIIYDPEAIKEAKKSSGGSGGVVDVARSLGESLKEMASAIAAGPTPTGSSSPAPSTDVSTPTEAQAAVTVSEREKTLFLRAKQREWSRSLNEAITAENTWIKSMEDAHNSSGVGALKFAFFGLDLVLLVVFLTFALSGWKKDVRMMKDLACEVDDLANERDALQARIAGGPAGTP